MNGDRGSDGPASSAKPRRPLPVPDEASAPYWAAAAKHVLTLARCANCKRMTLPPDVTCPHCGTTEPRFTFAPVSGRGRVRTWTVVHRAFLQGFDLPYVLVDVELDDTEGVRIIGRLLDGTAASLKIGTAVKVAFEDLSPQFSVPAFQLEHGA